MSKSKTIKGYKVFNPDWTCRGFKYKIGKTYTYDDEIVMCLHGFHFCTKAVDCFSYYEFNPENKVAEVEAIGNFKTNDSDSKIVTDKIHIIREIQWAELLEIVNTGKGNTGFSNSGHRNSGHSNSGYFNSCSFSSGIFNSQETTIRIFNQPSHWMMKDWWNSKAFEILRNFTVIEWISEENMKKKEKKEHPEYEITGGYLKTMEYKEAWKKFWKTLTNSEKKTIMNLPNFDKKVFKEITGITIRGVK